MEREIHYYGDLVRRFFLGGAVLMLLTLPFVNPLLPFPIFTSILVIIILCLVAGLTNPLQAWVAVINEITAVIAVLVFEYYAVMYYQNGGVSVIFNVNQVLSLNILVAFYYSTKNLRGIILS